MFPLNAVISYVYCCASLSSPSSQTQWCSQRFLVSATSKKVRPKQEMTRGDHAPSPPKYDPMRIMEAVISRPSLFLHSSLCAVETWATTSSAHSLLSHSMYGQMKGRNLQTRSC